MNVNARARARPTLFIAADARAAQLTPTQFINSFQFRRAYNNAHCSDADATLTATHITTRQDNAAGAGDEYDINIKP